MQGLSHPLTQLAATIPSHFQVSPPHHGSAALQGFAPSSRTWQKCCSDVPSPSGCLAAHALCILPADKTRWRSHPGDLWGLSLICTPEPILQAISALAKINTHTHKESVRTRWHKLKPSINSQAGFPASLGQGPVFQVSATSLKEARQGRETGTGW